MVRPQRRATTPEVCISFVAPASPLSSGRRVRTAGGRPASAHTGRQVFKDRLLKLPTQITSAFDDYVRQYDVLFPRTPRLITQVLNEAGQRADITKPVSVSILREMFVVRSVRRRMPLDDALAKLGLAK